MTVHIHHLVITTGHSLRSLRRQHSEPQLAEARDLVLRARALGEPVPLHGELAGATLTLDAAGGRCIYGTVDAGALRLSTFGVAAHARCGAGLWRRLFAGARAAEAGLRRIDPMRAPQAPWCAALLGPDRYAWPASPAADLQLDTLQQRIAWAWIDILAERRHAA